jgi:hypothetical protein
MKVSSRQVTAEVSHPDDPNFIVTLRKPMYTEGVELATMLSRLQAFVTEEVILPDGTTRRVAVLDPATNQPLKRPDLPVETLVDVFEKFAVDVRGFEVDDKPAAYAGADEKTKRATLRAVMNLSPVVTVNGTPDGATRQQNFFEYLLAKALDPATFGASPGKA